MARFNLRFVSKSLLRKTEVNLVIPSLDLHGVINEKICVITVTVPKNIL